MRFVVLVLALVAFAPVVAAQSLTPGADVPTLEIEKWVKGDAFKFEKGKVYVVEFWATWCGPCIASMPHLSELQEHYGDVTFVGVTKEDPNNSLAAVEEMVRDKGPGMGYTVAWDAAGKTYDNFMTASGSRGIPTSFIVDQNSKIAYIGHPMGLDIPLKMVVAGKWDPAKAQEIMAPINERIRDAVMKGREDPQAGVAAIDAIVKDTPELANMLDQFKNAFLLKAKMWDAYDAHAKKAVAKAIKYRNPQTLNQVAWTIVDPAGEIEKKNLDLALRAAQKGVEFTHEKDAAILDTLARVWFLKAKFDKAVKLQEQAVALQVETLNKAKKSGGAKAAEQHLGLLMDLKKTLAEFKAKAGAGDAKKVG